MSETTHTYDPAARNRFDYSVVRNGLKYEIAFIFGELSDDRYLQWLKEFKISGDDDNVSEESREASVRLFDETVNAVEGVEFDEGVNWREFIPSSEKIQALNDLLAVAIVETEKKADGKLRLGPGENTQVIITEAWQNGEIRQQEHRLVETSIELEKKYSRIQSKRFKQEQTRGLRRKAKVEFVAQDEKLGDLYDEMITLASGFTEAATVPLRFKTAVIHEVFAPTLQSKSLGK